MDRDLLQIIIGGKIMKNISKVRFYSKRGELFFGKKYLFIK